MKILYTCTYSAGISGVWNRVYNLSKEMIRKGHEVNVFSSNLVAGTDKHAKPYELINRIKVYRFPVKLKISDNASFWAGKKFKESLEKIKPDVIDCQTYRHPETTAALKIAKKLNIPCILTTHAPFVEKAARGLKLNLLAFVYDILIGKKALDSFDKIVAISKWEIPYLIKLGVKKENIEIISNGISPKFFKVKSSNKLSVIYLGRIAPIKNLEMILDLAKKFPELKFKIKGPIQKGYSLKSKSNNLAILNQRYSLGEELKELSKASIFILPSKREGIPQALIEAMAAGLIVISSSTQGGKELVKDSKNGFLFEIGNEKELEKKLAFCIRNFKKLKRIRNNSRKAAGNYNLEKIADRIENLYKLLISR